MNGNRDLGAVSAAPLSRRTIIGLIVAGISLILVANAHFVYVSVISAPDCVAHSKLPAASGTNMPFRAAKSAC